MASLDVYMNEYYVGIFTKKSSGAHSFQYTEDWVNQPGSRPISLSMPLQLQEYQGDCVYNSLIICYLIILKLEIVL